MNLLEVNPFYAQIAARQTGWKRLLVNALPLHFLVSLHYEMRMLMLRMRSSGLKRRFSELKDVLINIGAGEAGQAGWINVDSYAAPAINCLCDCRKQLPFPDGSAKGIFSEHFFEHLDYTGEVPFFLSECFRVLQPGGVLRIIVPDAAEYLRCYCSEGWEALAALRALGPDFVDPAYGSRFSTKMELINEVFRQGGQHKYAYDFETLAYLLQRFGFREIERRTFRSSRMEELCLDQERRKSESLYVEAVK